MTQKLTRFSQLFRISQYKLSTVCSTQHPNLCKRIWKVLIHKIHVCCMIFLVWENKDNFFWGVGLLLTFWHSAQLSPPAEWIKGVCWRWVPSVFCFGEELLIMLSHFLWSVNKQKKEMSSFIYIHIKSTWSLIITVWDKLIYFHSLLPIMYLYSKTIISTPRLYISTLRFLANFDTTLFAWTHLIV